jgi:hypothetical protein
MMENAHSFRRMMVSLAWLGLTLYLVLLNSNVTSWPDCYVTDEYLVPMGNYTSVLPLLEKLDKEDKKIISFASWRAWPRRTHIK